MDCLSTDDAPTLNVGREPFLWIISHLDRLQEPVVGASTSVNKQDAIEVLAAAVGGRIVPCTLFISYTGLSPEFIPTELNRPATQSELLQQDQVDTTAEESAVESSDRARLLYTLISSTGLSFASTATELSRSTTRIPSLTRPKMVCFLSRCGVGARVMKNWSPCHVDVSTDLIRVRRQDT
jgi:hypothetical protein